jgi:hypothetical protein
LRDDEALGEEVNDRLVDWAGQVGIYPGQLDRVRAANFGRLMMLTHKVIAAEEKCSPQEAIERSVQIHNELMHTFVEEASALSHLGSLALRRFLADIWAWLGGNREWHKIRSRHQPGCSTRQAEGGPT